MASRFGGGAWRGQSWGGEQASVLLERELSRSSPAACRLEPGAAPRRAVARSRPPLPRPQTDPARAAIGHTTFGRGVSQMDCRLACGIPARWIPPGPAFPGCAGAGSVTAACAVPPGSRFSADAWLMVRQDTTSSVVSGRPSYGRSQAGAVSLSPCAVEPVLLRHTSAPARRSQGAPKIVAGLSGQLLRRAAALAAGLDQRDRRRNRTAPGGHRRHRISPAGAPSGRAEHTSAIPAAFAAAFVDGLARVEHSVARLGEGKSPPVPVPGRSAEGRAWLDIGPTAAVSFRLGEGRGRVAAIIASVAGEAEPKRPGAHAFCGFLGARLRSIARLR